MYNVHMRKYSVAMVRERLAEALDQAEQGRPVLIERRGVTYELTVRKRAPKRSVPQMEVIDGPLIETGDWSWDWRGGALNLRPRRGR
jgi:hypothetical protein